MIGRFLSVDPVSVDTQYGINFPRYWYANNNPYGFTDPDGRYVCKGNNADCASVKEGVEDLKAAAAKLDEGSTEREVLDRVVAFYGEEGEENGVTVKVSYGGPSAGSARTVGGQTTLTYNPLEHGEGFGGTLDRHERAATLAHEGNHGVDQRRWGMTSSVHRLEWGEKRAIIAEAAYFKGANFDARSGVWTRSGGIDSNAVDKQSLSSLKAVCPAGGSCK